MSEHDLVQLMFHLDNYFQNSFQERADIVWGDDLPCISLTTGASAMHKLRPQPSWDRTCTAGAAIGLLDELHLVPQFNSLGLDKQAEAVENSVDVLLASLTARRVRMGRSITRTQRHYNDFS
ncbi:DTW domain-containing protein [Tanacetum coccineum]